MRILRTTMLGLMALGLLGVQDSASAATVISFQDGVAGYGGTQDATIQSAAGTANFDNVVGSGALIAQESWGATLAPFGGTTLVRTAMLRFDNIFASIPTGATINSATLNLTVTNAIEGLSLATMLATWDESTVTWDTFGVGVPSTGGGITPDGVEAAAALQVVGTYTGGDIDVTARVQDWLDNPGTNFGWAFLRDDVNRGTFVAAEGLTVSERPLLTIDYTAIPEPNALAMLAIGSFGLLTSGRRRK